MTWRNWLQLAALAVLWGLPYLFIAVALEELAPSAIVLTRVALAAIVLVPLAMSRGLLHALRRERWRLIVVAALDTVAPFLLIAVAQQAITSALTGVLVASVPLFVVVLAGRVDPRHTMDRARAVGFVVGFVGVALLLGIDLRGGPETLLGGAAVLGASACYALAALLIRRWFSAMDAVTLSAAVLMIATILMTPVAAVGAEPAWPSLRVGTALLALGLASTAAAFLLFYKLVQQAGADRASLVTYLSPAVAVLAGALLLHEDVTVSTLVGLAMILAGAAMAGRGWDRARATAVGPRRGYR